jgi:hypothetical protein
MKIAAVLLLAAPFLSAIEPGERVNYEPLAMQPKAWKKRGISMELTPWTGGKVVFLTTDAQLDRDLMGRWVSRLDGGWQLYADLTGRLPKPFRQIDGRATIAAVPAGDLTCGVGCGYIGVTGIEIAKFYDDDLGMLKRNASAMPHYVFYEMGRNFYTFGDKHSCFITGFAVFMRYVCMDALKCEDPDAATRKVIEDAEKRFAKCGLSFLDLFTNVTWKNEKAHRLKDDSGREIVPTDQPVTYASAMLRLRRENGGDAWLKRFFAHLAQCPDASPQTQEGALQQCLNWFICASLAAGKDLSPLFAGEWRLPLTKEQRAALASLDWKAEGLTAGKVNTLLAAPAGAAK